MHLFLHVVLLQIRTIDPREDIPVDKSGVIARRIIAEIAELRACPALRREMFTARAIGETPRRIDPQPAEPIEIAISEKRRELRSVAHG